MILEYANLIEMYKDRIIFYEEMVKGAKYHPDIQLKYETKINDYKSVIDDLERAAALYSMRKEIENEAY